MQQEFVRGSHTHTVPAGGREGGREGLSQSDSCKKTHKRIHKIENIEVFFFTIKHGDRPIDIAAQTHTLLAVVLVQLDRQIGLL